MTHDEAIERAVKALNWDGNYAPPAAKEAAAKMAKAWVLIAQEIREATK